MNPTVLRKKHGFANYPSVRLKGDKENEKGEISFGNLKQLIFGDYIKLLLNNRGKPIERLNDGITYVKVRARNQDGYVKPEEILPDRILEVNFVDIGQGDGCHIVTPDDKHFLIDAGQSDNMYRFLKWRFNLKSSNTAPPPFTVIITHSDADHYKGFKKIFTPANDTKQQFTINKVLHNGMVELSGSKVESLGTELKHDGRSVITDLCDTNAQFNRRAQENGIGDYVKTLQLTEAPKESLRYKKSQPIYKKDKLTMEVVGPIAEKVNGQDALPVFKSNKGKTKNGHSVLVNLKMGKFKVFLGGDLNTEAEDYLLSHYSGVDVADVKKQLGKKDLSDAKRKQLAAQLDGAILEARNILQCDVAKSCHHGSSDFTSEFLRALNPIATVISSGDEEPHCHPRPDTLGTIGKYSRGDRSLIFSTELSRSSKEYIDLTKIKAGQKKERVVTVYGMINLRTDGNRAIIAQKLERPAPRGDWDIQEIVWDKATSEFVYKP